MSTAGTMDPRTAGRRRLSSPRRTTSRRRGRSTSQTATLKVAYGAERGNSLRCRGDQPVVMGRHSRCDLRLLDHGASRWHAAITLAQTGQWQITDLESENGTFVNGQRIGKAHQLEDQDLIRIGSSLVTFHI